MKICPKCLRQYESGNFCENCENEDGSPVKLEEEQVSCPKCGLKYKKGTKFCSECGTRLDGTGTSNAAGAAGLSMGDKNVIAGDVIGHKEETHITGNATIIKNEDQTKQVKKCHICGSIVPIVDGFDCPECHQFTCASCFDSDAGCCTDCVEQHKKRNEEEFKSALKMAYADGRIEYSERQQLITLQHKLKISDEKAKKFEQQFRGDTAEALTTTEKLSIEQATKLYYKEENYTEALNLIKPIFENHQTREEVLNLYLPLLAETDSEQALSFINSMQVDILMAYITAIDIALKNDDLNEAELKYKQAARIWPENALVKCYQVLLNYALYKKFNQQNFLDKAKEIVEDLGEAQNELELSMQVRVQMFMQEATGEILPEITKQFCEDNQLYWLILKFNPLQKRNAESYTVGFDDDCDFQSIQQAIDLVADGGTINIRPGIYNEHLEINKKISLMGSVIGDISDYASKDLPIIVLDPEKSCVIETDSYIQGLVFTHKKDLNFDKMENILDEEDDNSEGCELCIEDEDFKTMLWIKADIQLHNIAILYSQTNGVTFSKGQALVDDLIVYCGGSKGIYCTNDAAPHITTAVALYNIFGIYVDANAAPIINGSDISKNSEDGIILHKCSNAVINQSFIHENYSNGISIFDNATPQINECEIYENEEGNIFIGDNAKPEITECTIRNSSCDGVYIANEATPQINECEVYENEGDNIYIRDNAKPEITECTIRNSSYNGVYITDDATPQIVECNIFENGCWGIKVDGTSNPNIIGCNIYENEYNGLFIFQYAKGTYKSLTINDNKTEGENYPGIVVSGNASPKIEECEVFNHLSCGIWIKEHAGGTYKDCSVHDNDGNGIKCIDNSNPKIKECMISDNASVGIYVCGKANPNINNCTIWDNQANGLVIADDATGKYTNCDIHDNLKNGENYPGVVARDNVCPTVEACEIYDHLSNGIWIKDNAKGTYKKCKVHDNKGKGICNATSNSIDTSTCEEWDNGN